MISSHAHRLGTLKSYCKSTFFLATSRSSSALRRYGFFFTVSPGAEMIRIFERSGAESAIILIPVYPVDDDLLRFQLGARGTRLRLTRREIRICQSGICQKLVQIPLMSDRLKRIRLVQRILAITHQPLKYNHRCTASLYGPGGTHQLGFFRCDSFASSAIDQRLAEAASRGFRPICGLSSSVFVYGAAAMVALGRGKGTHHGGLDLFV
jgi:hypothetical protein